ncbi:hypothetical protein JOD43_000025 [Pullulanibacillus pueri]|uniref:GIY-YIG domain-containing protein n=1 Tax=Pullulanibacillus pueri TaxID=1437324 RepID=A0A8J2ZQF3_9BACL|nr:hypothetical protein [Pullulanibacillus pueri]MBM7679866.1 hypothetical protein [Pullulanibacillus pueri]GGH73228.1 hypothetical protein GCM10007096_00250 [Pullulanibacillus pueri]
MEINTDLIQIQWEGPYKLIDLVTIRNEEYDYGLYQIYGKHPIYGSNVLLYIGKADSQTFGIRISQENWVDTNDSNNISIYVGKLHGEGTPSEEQWSKEIDLAERLLIYVHKPAYNARSVSSFPNTKLQSIHILNWGDHRDLLPEVSGLRYTSKLDHFEYKPYKWE